MSKPCFWYSQGRCQLENMNPGMVYGILTKNPAAREGILTCADSCMYALEEYVKFAAQKGTLITDEVDDNVAFTKPLNQYRDLHRLAPANSTLPKPPSEE